MSKSCVSNAYLFQEAINHVRWKTTLRTKVLKQDIFQKRNLHKFAGKSFEEILLTVHNICKDITGIGMLSVYDITAAICRFNNINIDKVYIVGKGPKRAVNLLNIRTKIQKIGEIALKYVTIEEVKSAFEKHGYILELDLERSSADDLESYLCNWQKSSPPKKKKN